MMKRTAAVLAAVLLATACSTAGSQPTVPDLAARGNTMTSAKLARQDLTNKVSLAGKVTMNPVFGLVAPVDGQVRFVDVKPPERTPTKPTKVATVAGKAVEVPANATMAG